MFLNLVHDSLQFASVESEYRKNWADSEVKDFPALSRHITGMCSGRKFVLMIDEVDQTSNNRIFLYFIGMLREKYLQCKAGMDYTFHSVILAGVYDIRNIKLKMIREGVYTPQSEESRIYNSPWNIAVNFTVDMSFSPAEIATMLAQYESDRHTGMDVASISEEIHSYTDGYPFLVSRICQCIDAELDRDWTPGGVRSAVTILLAEKNTLFDDIGKNLENNKELYDFMYSILITGKTVNFNALDPVIDLGVMYGFLKNATGKATVSNRIFELIMANYFISKESRANTNREINGVHQYDVVKDGRFDMELCLRKFAAHYAELFGESDYKFIEKHGRMLFLMYLKPLINGQGFYHIESQFTDLRRMDVVVDFGPEQFLVELKLWRGEAKHQDAYRQLLGYMESKNAATGYLLTFDLRKKENKRPHAKWVKADGRRLFDVVV